jgi:hypothetical protein
MISRWRVDIPEVTLGIVLDAARKQQSDRDWALSWSFYGTYLVIPQTDIELSRQQGEEWFQESHPALANWLQDFASALVMLGSG